MGSNVAFDIKYMVGGTNKFKGMFDHEIKSLDHMIKKFDDLSKKQLTKGGKPTRTAGGFALTPDIKEAASAVRDYMMSIRENNKGVKDMDGHIKSVTASLKSLGGQVQATKLAHSKLRANPEKDVGKTQRQLWIDLKENLEKARMTALTSAKETIAKVGKGIDAGKVSKEFRTSIESAYSEAIRRARLALKAGQLTNIRASEIRGEARAGAGLAKHGFRQDVSGMKTTAGKLGKLGEQADVAKQRIIEQFDMIKKAFGPEMSKKASTIKDQFIKATESILKDITIAKTKGTLKPEMIDKASKEMKEVQKQKLNQLKAEKAMVMKSTREAKSAETAVANARRNTSKQISSMISSQIDALKMEKIGRGKGFQKHVDKYIQKHRDLLTGVSKQIDEALSNSKGKTKAEVQKMMDNILTGAKSAFSGIKREKAGSKRELLGKAFSKQNLAIAGGVAGAGLINIGGAMEKAITSSHTKGRVASAMSDMMMSAFMVTSMTIFREVTNIIGQTVDIMVESILEIPRMLASVIAGMTKSLGIMLEKGLIIAFVGGFTAVAGAIGAPMTAGLSVVVALVVGAFLTLKTIFEEGLNFISGIMKAIMSVIGSVIKLIISTVSILVKSLVKSVMALIKGLFTSLKEAFASFMEFVKKGMSTLVSLVKASIQEFATVTEFATRAFKETVGVAGQSLRQFQTLISGLRATFGFTKEDVGEAVFDIVSSGFRNVAKAKEISASASMLAIAAESDLKTSTNALITALQNFDMQGETSTSIMKTLASATTLGRMTMGELGNAMKSVMGLASRANVTFKDTMLSLSMMTRVFGRGSIEQGTRFFNRFLESIAMPRSQGRKQLEALGISMEGVGKKAHFVDDVVGIVKKMEHLDLKDVRKVFSTIQSRRAWLALTKDVKQFQMMMKDFDVISKNVKWQFEQMFNTPQRLIKRLQESFGVLLSNIGMSVWKSLKDVIFEVVKAMKNLMTFLNSNQAQKFFEGFIKWAKPIVNTVFKPITSAMNDLMMFFIRGRGLGNQFWKIFETDFAKELQQGLIKIINNIFDVIRYITLTVSKLKMLKDIWKSIKSTISNVFKALSGTEGADWIANMINGLNTVKTIMVGLLTGQGMDVDVGKKILKSWHIILSEVQRTITGLLSNIASLISLYFTPIIDRLMALIGVRLKENLIDGFSQAMGFFSKQFATMDIPGVPDWMEDAFSKMLGGVSGVTSFTARNKENIQTAKVRNQEVVRQLKKLYDLQKSRTTVFANKAQQMPFQMWIKTMEKSLRGKNAFEVTPDQLEFQNILKANRGDIVREVAVGGGFGGKEDIQANLVEQYGTRISKALEDLPKGLQLRLGRELKVGGTFNIGSFIKGLREVMTDIEAGKDIDTERLDKIITRLASLKDETTLKTFGIDLESETGQYSNSVNQLISLSDELVREYRIRVESEKRAISSTDAIANANKRAIEIFKKSLEDIGMSASKVTDEIKKVFKIDVLGKDKVSPADIQKAIGGRIIDGQKTGAQKQFKQVTMLEREEKQAEDKVKRAQEAFEEHSRQVAPREATEVVKQMREEFAKSGLVDIGDETAKALEAKLVQVIRDLAEGDTKSLMALEGDFANEAIQRLRKRLGDGVHGQAMKKAVEGAERAREKTVEARGGESKADIRKRAMEESQKNFENRIKALNNEDLKKEFRKQEKIRNKSQRKVDKDSGMEKSEEMRIRFEEFTKVFEAGRQNIQDEDGTLRPETRSEFGKRVGAKSSEFGLTEENIKQQEASERNRIKRGTVAQKKMDMLQKERGFRVEKEVRRKKREKQLEEAPTKEKKEALQRKFDIEDKTRNLDAIEKRRAQIKARIEKIGDHPTRARDRIEKKQLEVEDKKLVGDEEKTTSEIKKLKAQVEEKKKQEKKNKASEDADNSIVRQEKQNKDMLIAQGTANTTLLKILGAVQKGPKVEKGGSIIDSLGMLGGQPNTSTVA